VKIGPVPTGKALFGIALRAWKGIIPYSVYLVRFLSFETGRTGRAGSGRYVIF
jgi:hypothetical protein